MYRNFCKYFALLLSFHLSSLQATDKLELRDTDLDVVFNKNHFIPLLLLEESNSKPTQNQIDMMPSMENVEVLSTEPQNLFASKELSLDSNLHIKKQYNVKIEGLDLIKNRSHEPIAKAINTALNKELRSDQLEFSEYLCQIEAIPVSPRVFILNCSRDRKYSLRAMFVSNTSDLRNATVRARAIMSHVNFSELGISPKVFTYDVAHGILISEYIDNEPLNLEKVDHYLIEKLTTLLKSIHITPKSQYYNLYYKREFSPYSLLKSSVEKVINLYPKQLSWHKETIFYMNLIYHILSPYPQNTLCHYEMHPLNLLCDKETKKLYVIDWETAFVGDPMFDLATISCLSNFDQSHDDLLLSSYYEHFPSQEEIAHFFLMKQHVYLFFSLQMIKSYNDSNIYITDKERDAFGILKPNCIFTHPLINTPLGNYHYSILLANTAFHHIKTQDFYHNLSIILSTYASNYRWLNQIHRNPRILLWLFEHTKKTNKELPMISNVTAERMSTKSGISGNQLLNKVHYVLSPDMLTYQLRLAHHHFLSTIPEKTLSISPILSRKQHFYTITSQITKTYLGRKWLERILIDMEAEEFLCNLVWKKHRDESYTLHSASLGKNKTFEDALNFIVNRLFEDRQGYMIMQPLSGQ